MAKDEVNKNNLTPKVINSMKMGETRVVISGKLRLRRVPGGVMYEYTDDLEYVVSSAFVSTDELVND